MTKSRRRKIILYVSIVVILPASLSLGCLFFMLHIKTVSNKGLLFSKKHIDLGELNYSQDVTANFPFKNTASKLIKITKLYGTCHCTDISADKMEILPGEEGVVSVTFKSASRRGPENHKVAVWTNAPGQEHIELTLSAIVDPRIELIPRAISFGQVEVLEPVVVDPLIKLIPRALSFGHVAVLENVKSRDVLIMSRFREPAKTISVSSSSPYIKATLLSKEPSYSTEAGKICVELYGNPPSGKLEGDITIKTRTEKGIVSNSLTVMADILDTSNMASL
jgi:hypothetical protein